MNYSHANGLKLGREKTYSGGKSSRLREEGRIIQVKSAEFLDT